MSDDPTTEDQDDLGPIIGDDPGDDEERRTKFRLVALDPRDRKTLHPMCARVGVDAATVDAFSNRKATDQQRLGAIKKFLMRSIVDDDGISVMEKPRAVVKRDSDWVDAATSDAKPSEYRYVVGDNTDWDSEEDAEEHAWNHGSSLRRFVTIWDSETLRLRPSVLVELTNQLVGEGAGRPTKPSKASSSGSKTRARSGRT